MSPSEKPEADRASTWSDKLMAPGDGLRQWWDRPVPGTEVGFRRHRLRAVGPAAAVPAAVPEHPEHQLRRHDGAVRDGGDHRDRPQRRGGPDGPARPRLRRVLRRRRVHRRAADQPEQSRGTRWARSGGSSEDWAWLACVPLAMAITALAGPDPRHADAAAARRLPGHRHARVRRDHPAAGRQPRRHHQRSRVASTRWPTRGFGESESLPEGVFSERQLDGRRQLRHLVVLAGHHPDRHHPAAGRQPGTQPGRARLGRHPRGRGRRGSDGRQHLPVQAVGVRDRRGDRRTVRCAVRRPGAVRRAADVQHHQLDAVPVRGRARRAGQQTGRHLRRVHHRLSAEPVAGRAVPRHQPRRPEVPVLRSGAGGADDLPAAGPVPGAPAAARLRQGRPRVLLRAGREKEPAR